MTAAQRRFRGRDASYLAPPAQIRWRSTKPSLRLCKRVSIETRTREGRQTVEHP